MAGANAYIVKGDFDPWINEIKLFFSETSTVTLEIVGPAGMDLTGLKQKYGDKIVFC